MKSVKHIQAINPVFALIVLVVTGLSTVLLATPYYPLAVLPALAVILLLLIGRFPEYGYYLIIFMIPFTGYTTLLSDYAFLTIPKIIGILVLIVLAFRFIVNKTKPIDAKSNLWILLIIFFAINFLSACSSDYPAASFDQLRRFITAYLIFFITLIFSNRHVYLHVLPKILAVSSGISSLIAIFGYIFNIEMLFIDITRTVGATGGPNELCMIIAFTLPFVAHLFFHAEKPGWRVIFGGVFVVNLIAMMMTYSRSGFIVTMFVLCLIGIYYFTKFKPRHIGFVILFLLLATIAAYLYIPESYKQRIQSSADYKTDGSIGRRVSYLIVGKEAFMKKPFFGHGPGTFGEIYARSTISRAFNRGRDGRFDLEGNKRAAHNLYIDLFVGSGLFSILIFLIILGIAFRNFNAAKAIFNKNVMPDMASITNAYQCCFLAILICGLFGSIITYKFFWIVLALSYVALRLSHQEQR